MTDKQFIRKFRKREKVLGTWMAERGYDAWDVFHKGEKLTRYAAVTKTPRKDYMALYPSFGYNWDNITFKKLT